MNITKKWYSKENIKQKAAIKIGDMASKIGENSTNFCMSPFNYETKVPIELLKRNNE